MEGAISIEMGQDCLLSWIVCSIDVSPWLEGKIQRGVDEVCSVEHVLFM